MKFYLLLLTTLLILVSCSKNETTEFGGYVKTYFYGEAVEGIPVSLFTFKNEQYEMNIINKPVDFDRIIIHKVVYTNYLGKFTFEDKWENLGDYYFGTFKTSDFDSSLADWKYYVNPVHYDQTIKFNGIEHIHNILEVEKAGTSYIEIDVNSAYDSLYIEVDGHLILINKYFKYHTPSSYNLIPLLPNTDYEYNLYLKENGNPGLKLKSGILHAQNGYSPDSRIVKQDFQYKTIYLLVE